MKPISPRLLTITRCGALSVVAVVVMGLTMTGMWTPQAALAQSIFDEPVTTGPEPAYTRSRLDEIDRQIAALLAAESAQSDPFTATALKADISYRIIIRTLLKTGLDAGEDGAVAILTAHTLADHATDMAAMFMKLPEMVRSVQGQTDNVDKAMVERIAAVERQLKVFNERAADPASTLHGAGAAHVDRAMQEMLAPLAAVARLTGEPDAVNTWLEPRDRQPVTGAGQVGSAYLDDMTTRIHSSSLTTATRTELLAIVQMLHRGIDQPDLRPRVMAMMDTVDLAIVAGSDLAQIDWFDAATAARLREQIHTAVLLVKDPRTRPAGVERLSIMVEHLSIARRLSTLAQAKLPTDRLRDLFLKSHDGVITNQNRPAAEAAMAFIDRLSQTMLTSAAIDPASDHPQFRPILLPLRAAYSKSQLALVNDVALLVADMNKITEATWTDQLDDLDAQLATMERVASIPAWIETMGRHKHKPTGGLFREIRAAANDLLSPDADRRRAADVRLAELQQQIQMFDPMPGEASLMSGSEAVGRVTDQSFVLLGEQIERLREDWTSAWASGSNPAATVERLVQITRLLRAIDLATRLGNAAQTTEQLNRWAAWQTPERTLGPMLSSIPEQVREASRLAAVGNWPVLDELLSRLAGELPLALLVGQLHGELMPGLAKLPTGVPGVLGQVLYGPGEKAYQAAHRMELARISVTLLETAHAQATGQTEAAQRGIAHARYLAAKLDEAP